jgi:hypothetical protein
VLADGVTVQMRDTTDNQADFPQLGSQKPGLGFPIACIVVLISLAAYHNVGKLSWIFAPSKPIWTWKCYGVKRLIG